MLCAVSGVQLEKDILISMGIRLKELMPNAECVKRSFQITLRIELKVKTESCFVLQNVVQSGLV